MKSVDVLIIDDEKDLAEVTKDYLLAMGIKALYVTNYEDFVSYFTTTQVKLILLDINLGDSSGYEICRFIRKSSDIPILFISVRTDDQDKVIALGVGGDDFIEKPYSLSVLAAKVKATLRRCYEMDRIETEEMQIDHLKIDLQSRVVLVNDQVVEMTVKEYELLIYLIQNKNKVIPKEKLYEAIWGELSIGELGTLNVHIRKIREKIEKDPSHPQYIKTVWGIGYKFEVIS